MYSQPNSQNLPWGLYQKDSKTALPLKSLDISVQILHNLARVFYTQTYQNTLDSLLETEFFFPISPDACFDSFLAKFNDTTIKGIIKEKEEAKHDYKEAVSAGNIAAYSEINKETGDLMKVLIGNIPPNSEVSVIYSYIEKMEVSLNKFWCFRLFSTFTPRYNGNLQDYLKRDVTLLANYPTISASDSYPWSIKVEIQSPSQIEFLESPTHNIVTQYGNEKHTCTITLNPDHTYRPNKDFVLLYSNGKENQADYLLTPFGEDYCAMVTLLADFNKTGAEEAYNNFAKAKQPEISYEMGTVRGEYIFLIDRSGSMEGDRIDMARSSLELFLKSLPKDSFYNIVSFGSSYSFLHASSLKYSQENLISSSQLIKKFQADMGGTEIYAALEKVFNSSSPKGYPKFLFLLTDGAVSDTQRVLQLIEKNNHKARVFTIGIGNGCSPELIQKGAVCGRGKHEFVADTKDIYAKVISLLDASLCPTYSEISLEAENFDALVKSVTPNPSSIPFLMNGQHITFFLVIRKEAFDQQKTMALELRLYDTRIQNCRTVKIVLDCEEAMKNDMIPKLAVHDMIKRLEEQKKNKHDEKQILWTDKAEITKALLELSLEYGILCKETAFFCEIAQNNDETRALRPVKVVVPTTLSRDYGGYGSHKLQEDDDDDLFCDDDDDDEEMMKLQSLSKKSAVVPVQKSQYFACMSDSESESERAEGEMEEEEENIEEEWQEQKENCYENYLSCDEPDLNGPVTENTIKPSSSKNTSYLNIIMEQTFEGYWDPANKAILAAVVSDSKLPEVPNEIAMIGAEAEKVWLTVLVLLWLEVVHQNEKQAWRLIYQKGCEWLKSLGVDYEQVKNFGESVIKN